MRCESVMKYRNRPVRGDVAVDAAVAATMFAPRRFARAASLPGCYGTRQTTRPTEVCAAAATAFRQLRQWWFSTKLKIQCITLEKPSYKIVVTNRTSWVFNYHSYPMQYFSNGWGFGRLMPIFCTK